MTIPNSKTSSSGEIQGHRAETGWLWTPPDGVYSVPPTESRVQILPLHELAWENFERLCLRLATRQGDVEHIQLYGSRGQRQDGIDIFLRHVSDNRYSVLQCKRYQKFTARSMKTAVTEFLGGKWAERTKNFYICVTTSLTDKRLADEIEAQANRLKQRNIAFIPLGRDQLSERLKKHPDLVDDFFHREWVLRFCGKEAADSLSRRRLDQGQVLRLRSLLREYYAQNFESVDPGLPVATSPQIGGILSVPLTERYVVPDIVEPHVVTSLREISVLSDLEGSLSPERNRIQLYESQAPAQRRIERLQAVTSVEEIRRPAMNWIVETDLNILLGDPGIGKSTLLRVLILDILSPSPRYNSVAQRWGTRLPVWIPFAMWTRMVFESEDRCSLPDLVAAWLHKVGAPQALRELVEQALEDERLLLLVDGLDEWSDETAARTTVSLLQTFALARRVPVVATSRPLGYERLGGMGGNWRIGIISGLSEGQKLKLAKIWFAHHFGGRPLRELDIQGKSDFVTRQAESFVYEIRRDAALSRLSSIPLLMSGLIALSIVNVELPRSRFKAYEELTRLLLQDHPQRREKSAMSRKSLPITQDSRDKALACLAFEIHSSAQTNTLDKEKSRDVLRDYLTAAIGKSAADAFEQAGELLTLGAQSVGILVEKSQQEVGFIHRAFQEFLAAKHISRLPFPEQQQFVKQSCSSPQWHDVILCLFHLNQRADEVDSLIGLIEGADLSSTAKVTSTLLMAETAFSDLHCSPEMSREIASKVFTAVETTGWMPLRKQLLDRALNGLRSDVMRRSVESKLKVWFPQRVQDPGAVYEAMLGWPADGEVFECLLRGLGSESIGDRGVAAEVVGRLYHDDPTRGERLREHLSSGGDIPFVAASLHALWRGWPSTPGLSALLAQAARSREEEMMLVGVRGRVERAEQTNEDKLVLLECAHNRFDRLTHWIGTTLVKGWPRDPTIKDLSLKSFQEQNQRERHLDPQIAARFLVKSFPGDPEVAKAIALIFRTERYVNTILGSVWPELVDNFKSNEFLAPAIDDWLDTREFYDNSFAYAALVSCSDRAKKIAINQLSQTSYNAAADALVVGWGLKDPIVLETLSQIAEDSELLPNIANELPRIITDRRRCRKLLIQALETKAEAVWRICEGLRVLDCDHSDQEVVEACLEAYSKAPRRVGAIFRLVGRDLRVKKLALRELEADCGLISSFAEAYADDPEIRIEIIRKLSSLPFALRRDIVDRLSITAEEDGLAHELLGNYIYERDIEISPSAAAGFYKTYRHNEDSIDVAAERLSREFWSPGSYPDHRLTSVAGLLALRRLDVLKEKPAKISVLGSQSLLRELAESWGYVEEVLGPSALERFDINRGELERELQVLGVGTARCETAETEHDPLDPSLIRIISLTHAKSERLRTLCLKMIEKSHGSDGYGAERAITAAEILGEQFYGEERLSAELEEIAKRSHYHLGPILALCEVNPRSEILREVELDDQNANWLNVPTGVFLACALYSKEELLAYLRGLLPRLSGKLWEFSTNCGRAFVRRMRKDEAFKQGALKILTETRELTGDEKSGLARIIGLAGGDTGGFLLWCEEELERQVGQGNLPELGFDLFEAKLRPVSHILLDILMPIRASARTYSR
ncbi:MAG TPA: NACHT domain-containing protein [Thermoanaerobaculia bacterium]|nr:NACHT domain-containing protein [Thermoanaerobaculia bacterium]